MPQRTAGGWLYDGVEYDPTFAKARGVFMPRNVAHFQGVNGIVWIGPGNTQDQYGYGYPNPHGGASLLPPWLGAWGTTVTQPGHITHNKRAVQVPVEQPNPSGSG